MAAALCSPAFAQDGGGAKHLTLLGIPSATVAPNGHTFVSLSYATERPGAGTGDDGSMLFGLGLGDADTGIGAQLTTQITSLTDNLGDSGYLGIQFSGRIAQGRTPLYLSLGVDRLAGWGDADSIEPSATLALTGFHLFESQRGGTTPLMFTIGAGSHVRDNQTEPGGFVGIGVGLSQSLAASVSYYGDHATMGLSYSPPSHRNLSFTASLVDVFDQTPDQRVVFTVNYLFPKAFGG